MAARRSALRVLLVASVLAMLPTAGSLAQGKKTALDGYDPVAYFTERRAVQGNSTISYDWDDRRYQFSSAKHRDLFVANPARYEPQFDGLCAGALANGRTVKADPTTWRIIDGKLYVYAKDLGSEEAFAKAAAGAKWKELKK